MQGRLTSKGGFFPQQFPWGNWENEFAACKALDVHFMEWMFNFEHYDQNPVFTSAGREKIVRLSEIGDVHVRSICANYFMERSIFEGNDSLFILEELMAIADDLNVVNIVLPFFGASEVGDDDLVEMKTLLKLIVDRTKKFKVQLALETNLSMDAISLCLDGISPNIGVCYDTGNAIEFGRDVVSDISKHRKIIKEIHIKDKSVNVAEAGGGSLSVMLGKGQAPLKELFSLDIGTMYFVLESYFGKDAIGDTTKNISYVRDLMGKRD